MFRRNWYLTFEESKNIASFKDKRPDSLDRFDYRGGDSCRPWPKSNDRSFAIVDGGTATLDGIDSRLNPAMTAVPIIARISCRLGGTSNCKKPHYAILGTHKPFLKIVSRNH